MTVNEAMKVCKVLSDRGYGNYSFTAECGFVGLEVYPNSINDNEKIINMEGEFDGSALHKDIKQALEEETE